jgi:integrase
MKSARGLGNCYQPSYRDRHGVLKHVATWWIVYHVHGKRITENAHTEDRPVAVRLLKQRLGEAGLGKRVGPAIDRATLDDLLALVEADYQANGRRSLKRVHHAAKHLRAFFRNETKARDITSGRVTAYKAYRQGEGQKAKPASVNYELAVLRRGFGLAVEDGCVATIPLIKKLEVHNAREGFFEVDQYRAVVKHLPDYLKAVAEVSFITGWRTQSELLTREWRHINFAIGWLTLDANSSKNGEGREFPFTPDLKAILEAQRHYVKEIERRRGCVIPWVFVHNNGSPIKDFRGAWKEACRAALVPGRLVHDLRRTAVRNLESAGVSRSAAMKLTGHRTENVYARYAIQDEKSLKEAVAQLAIHHAASGKRESHAKVSSGK